LNENYIPNDKDLDISLKHLGGKILYDFWRSDYEKNYIGLSDWLEKMDMKFIKMVILKGLMVFCINFGLKIQILTMKVFFQMMD
jgi:hypothetical protein